MNSKIEKIWEKSLEYKIQQKYLEFRPFLELLISSNGKSMLEIGSCFGGTTIAFSMLFENVITVDMMKNFEFNEVLQNCDYTFIEGDSHSNEIVNMVSLALSGSLVDCLFIDGDHSESGVTADYNNFLKFVKPGGIIAFHDIVGSEEMRRQNCLVSNLWDRLIIEYPNKDIIEFKDLDSRPEDPYWSMWGGIGVINV